MTPASAKQLIRRRWFRAPAEVVWLGLAALAVRAAAAWSSPAILNDSVDLLDAARRVAESGIGASVGSSHHPLPLVLVAWLSRSLDPEFAATALGVVGGSVAVWPLHTLARRLCGRHAATVAGLIYAALPTAVGVAAVPLTEGIFAPLFLGSLAMSVRVDLASSRAQRHVRCGIAGALAAAAYLCRPEGLVVAGGAVVAAWATSRPGRRWAAAAVVAGAFALVAAPYPARLSSDAGRLVLTPKKDVARFVAGTAAPAAGRGAETPPPLVAAQRTAMSLGEAVTWPVLVLVVVGSLCRRRWSWSQSRRPRAAVLLTVGVLLAAVLRLNSGWGYGGSRHALTAGLCLLPFAGEGLLAAGGLFPRVTSRRRFAVFAATLLAAPLAARAILRPAGEGGMDARRLGERLAETVVAADDGRDLVIGTFGEPRVAYYAARKLAGTERTARDVRLWGPHANVLENSRLEGQRRALSADLAREGVTHVVLDLFAEMERHGTAIIPGRELAARLGEDGVLAAGVVAAGGRLAAFPLR